MSYKSGKPSAHLIKKAKQFLLQGEPESALKILSGAVYGAGYDVEFFELFGKVLCETGNYENAGRFLFLSGVRDEYYLPFINQFIKRNHNPNNFRQLHSKFPMRVKCIWLISRYPQQVYKDLKILGFPDNIQEYFIGKRERKISKN